MDATFSHKSPISWCGSTEARPRAGSTCIFLWLGCMVFACGCHPPEATESNLQFNVQLQPTAPAVGEATVLVGLSDVDGAPVTGAEVRVEGNMNHAGMKPSFAELKEDQPGRYAGALNFTMGGDWFLLITVKTTEGDTAEHKLDVPGVRTK